MSTPWTAWPVGSRVVVRRRMPGGGFTDVLGDVVSTDPEGVVVRTRTGEHVTVPAADIAVGKRVPPPPPRRAPRAPQAPPAPGTPRPPPDL